MTLFSRLFLTICAYGLIGIWAVSCTSETSPMDDSKGDKASDPIDVYVDKVAAQELADKLIVGGWLEAKNQRFVYSQVAGVVSSILKQPDHSLKNGDVILKVMPNGAGWEVKPHPVVSDIRGRVMRLLVKQGDRVESNERLAMIGDDRYFEIAGRVTYGDLGVLRDSSSIDVVLPAVQPTAVGKASIVGIEPAADTSTGTFGIRFQLLCSDDVCRQGARAGLLAKVVIKSNIREQVVLSQKLIHRSGKQKYVLVVNDDGTARKSVVEVGESWGTKLEILSGVAIGERVIVSSASTVQDKDRVKVVKDLSVKP